MFAWVDVETTGLEPRDSSILEVALVITDSNLNIEKADAWVLRYDGLIQDSEVREMHTNNGLLVQCFTGINTHSLEHVQSAMCDILGCFGGKMPMAGNSVQFDRAFLKHLMPKAESCFHYRNIDVSTIRRLATHWKPEIVYGSEPSKHRAFSDILSSIAELAHYRKHWLC